jgi:hypothetical protein
MTAPSDTAAPLNFSAGIGSVLRLVVPLPGATGDDRQQMGLQPGRRLATSVLPIVGRATGATRSGDDLGGGVIGNLVSEGHGQTIHRKNKSAMPKIILAIRRQCRHITRMSNTNQTKPTFVEITAKFFGITIEQAQAMIDKADARNQATHEKGMALKDSVAQGKFAKGGIWA